jgi:hypothetical protein
VAKLTNKNLRARALVQAQQKAKTTEADKQTIQLCS